MLIRVGAHAVDLKARQNNMPGLLACIHPDSDLKPQIRMLEHVAERFAGRVTVYVMIEELTMAFSQKYAVDGTPTFLFFQGGQVKDRLLGQVDVVMLTDFVTRNSGQGC
jgi:hypothetical protein